MHRAAVAVVAAAATVVLASGCSAFRHDARIVGYGGDPVGAGGLSETKSHHPYLLNDIEICLDRPGDAFITDVTPINPQNGLTITNFAAVPRIYVNGGQMTDTGDTIADVTATPSREVTQACPPATETGTDGAQYGYTLFVQYTKPDDRSAWDDGIRVAYTSAGHHYTTDMHFQFALCTTGDPSPEVDHVQLCT